MHVSDINVYLHVDGQRGRSVLGWPEGSEHAGGLFLVMCAQVLKLQTLTKYNPYLLHGFQDRD